MGFLHIGIYNGCYINVCEYVDIRWKNKVCTLLLVFDMLTVIIIGIYWRFISKYWLWLQIFALAINLLAIIGLYIIPESPEYLYCFYRFYDSNRSQTIRILDHPGHFCCILQYFPPGWSNA
jgi:hypothetical protein